GAFVGRGLAGVPCRSVGCFARAGRLSRRRFDQTWRYARVAFAIRHRPRLGPAVLLARALLPPLSPCAGRAARPSVRARRYHLLLLRLLRDRAGHLLRSLLPLRAV